jgi:uncharacterized protein YndB with AHSA1/START domain
MFGTVRTLPDGRVELRYERRLAHSRDNVWRALTSTDELRRWFVEILDYDRSTLDFTPGADLTFVAGGHPAGRGKVLTAEPPCLLEYTWDEETLRWELTEHGDGCLLVFTNVVPDPATATVVDEGWQLGMERLADALDL